MNSELALSTALSYGEVMAPDSASLSVRLHRLQELTTRIGSHIKGTNAQFMTARSTQASLRELEEQSSQLVETLYAKLPTAARQKADQYSNQLNLDRNYNLKNLSTQQRSEVRRDLKRYDRYVAGLFDCPIDAQAYQIAMGISRKTSFVIENTEDLGGKEEPARFARYLETSGKAVGALINKYSGLQTYGYTSENKADDIRRQRPKWKPEIIPFGEFPEKKRVKVEERAITPKKEWIM